MIIGDQTPFNGVWEMELTLGVDLMPRFHVHEQFYAYVCDW
jgi:hypothetical protein